MTDPIRISDDQHNNAPAVPQGWTDADSDAARLALELECLLMDTKDLSVVSKWWGSANDALELHRQRLAATPAPAPAQEPETALQKFTRFKVAETEGNPVEMLRAFCAFAMNSQDWFDVEPFFDLVREAMASRTAVAPAQEVVMPTDKQIIQAMTAEFPTPSLVPMLKGSVICGDFHKALVSAVNVGIAEFCRINGIGQPAQEVGLTEAERVRFLIASGCIGTVKMTYDSGPYEITRTSINASRLIDAIIAALRAKGGKL